MSTTKQTLRFYMQHAWKYPRYVIGILVTVPITVLVQQFIPPLIVADVLARLSNGDFAHNDLWGSFGSSLLLYAVLVLIGNSIAWRVVTAMIWRLEATVHRDMWQRIFKHLMAQDASFHANNFGGALVTQAHKFCNAYVRLADTFTFQVYTLILSFTLTIIILAPKAPLFVVALLVLSAVYIATAYAISKPVRELNAEESAIGSKQNGYLADSVTNVMTVKSFAANEQEATHFAKATEDTRRATMNLMRATMKRDTYFGSVNGMIMASSLAIATASVVLFDADIAVVFLIVSYTANITQRLWDFGSSTLKNYNRAIGEAKDMTEILSRTPEVIDVESPEESNIKDGAIAFEDMSFTHGDTKKGDALFSKFNLAIAAGQKVGLVGHSGSGKSTLTRLLLRFSNVDAGKITIDGQDISKITQHDLRSSIAYVAQEPMLFHRSIKENIAYGNPSATDKEIFAAAKKAHADEFIKKLPDGYQTTVGERGVKLSGGQRQRVAIARAILKDAPILVLDEATSALDSESEVLIQKALEQLMKNRTTIVIAHRLSTIQKMDRIVVLDNGAVAESGTHAELIAQKGAYAKLWAHQSGGFIEE